jgi:hypothetical protein
MNSEKCQNQEYPHLEEALRNVRASIHAWSDREFVRPRAIERSRWAGFWQAIANPALGGTLAATMLVAAIGVPVGVYHEREVAAQRQALELQRKQAAEQARKAAAAAATSIAVDDGAFLDDVDSDIAQDAPDAMQPLASLMNDGAGKSSRR